jgi:hypothetical protein
MRAFAKTAPRIDGSHGCLGCLSIEHEPAQLHDGRTVCAGCFELADEREAGYICNIESKTERAEELLKIQIKRGRPAADRIRAKVELLWPERKWP